MRKMGIYKNLQMVAFKSLLNFLYKKQEADYNDPLTRWYAHF